MAQLFYTPFVVDHTKCGSSNSSNFPVVLSITDVRFKDAAHSGHVAGTAGFDIRPYSDAACTTALTYQLRSYAPATGAIEMVVQVPTLSVSSDFTIYLGYGDSSLTTDGSSTSVWNANFLYAWNMATTGSPVVATDGTSSGNTLTANSVTLTDVAGQIGRGVAVDSNSGHSMTPATSIAISGAWSMSYWWKPTSYAGAYMAFSDASSSAKLGTNSTNMFARVLTGGSSDSTVAAPTPTGNFHFAKWTRDASNKVRLSLDGGAFSSPLFSNAAQAGTWTINQLIPGMNATADEIRVATVADSIDWTIAEYQNGLNPCGVGGFAPMGSESAVGGGGGGSRIRLYSLLNGLGASGPFFRNPLG